MNNFLELGEHCLPEKRAADIVDLAIDDVGAHFRVVRLFEQMMREQFLVKCRCNFGQENRVIVILEKLRLLREPTVHRVPGLVRERVDVGEHVLFIIHQDVGGRAVTAGRERAAAFPFRFVTIDPPALAHTLSENIDIFFA